MNECETCGGRALECAHKDGGSCAMDTPEMRALYEVIGFAAGCVVVIRKSDAVKGSLTFDHAPRRYYGWIKA